MLDEHDQAAIFGLLIQTVRLQEAVKRDQAVVTELNARIVQNNVKASQVRTALQVFGFVPKPDVNVWDEVKQALGQARYNEAIEIGKKPPASALRLEDRSTRQKGDEDNDEVTGEEEVDDVVVGEAQSPRISDVILAYLKERGDRGAKVADIRRWLEATYNIKTHEKTPGMTLYRLSQQEPALARRDGRTWFFVPQIRDETKNPGAATPGLNGSSE